VSLGNRADWSQMVRLRAAKCRVQPGLLLRFLDQMIIIRVSHKETLAFQAEPYVFADSMFQTFHLISGRGFYLLKLWVITTLLRTI
jgi:hypothetical protein